MNHNTPNQIFSIFDYCNNGLYWSEVSAKGEIIYDGEIFNQP